MAITSTSAKAGGQGFIAELSAKVPFGITAWLVAQIDTETGPIVVFAEHPDKAKQGLSVTNGTVILAGGAFSTFPFLADLDPATTRMAETYMFDPTYEDAGLLKRYRLDEVRFDSVRRENGRWLVAGPSWRPMDEAEQKPLLVRLREMVAAAGLLPHRLQ